ncbi:acetylxylan esterase [Streptococcus equi]|uniref:acetylxylan esterase n=1 Tax=Streptococcus equi TaxID=1336 RepID=UPI001E3C3DD5|nr:acetylxylan esterase [Streptococcus equi]
MIETMSLEEMMSYRGRHEVPKDFDHFWETCIKENQAASYQLDQKDFGLDFADCYELRFKGSNGSTIYAKCVFPKAKQLVPVVFYFHGYQGQSPDWSDQFNYLAQVIKLITPVWALTLVAMKIKDNWD